MGNKVVVVVVRLDTLYGVGSCCASDCVNGPPRTSLRGRSNIYYFFLGGGGVGGEWVAGILLAAKSMGRVPKML